MYNDTLASGFYYDAELAHIVESHVNVYFKRKYLIGLLF